MNLQNLSNAAKGKAIISAEDDFLEVGNGIIPLLSYSTGNAFGSNTVEGERLLHVSDQQKEEEECEEFHDDPEFASIFNDVQDAIASGIQPSRISQGSSGSYFVRNMDNKIVGVFKPKDEEPYGHLNPKWTKWLHKMCCPCLFGRSCLVPNQGYLSEAGASIIDRRFNLGVVPSTKVVKLASPAFNYSRGTRWFSQGKLPRKVGSLQLFVTGYKDAEQMIGMFETEGCSPELKVEFAQQFERLAVLDYITRNTDRGNDNWLVKVSSDEELQAEGNQRWKRRVKIAAIDNGLSFPYKHPDLWRTYPYYWAWLPQAKVPFSQELKAEIYPLVTDEAFIESTLQEIYAVFKEDAGFSKSHCERQ
eukprot:Ihof_evm14s81 gene=Ihof_evmTU14s81